MGKKWELFAHLGVHFVMALVFARIHTRAPVNFEPITYTHGPLLDRLASPRQNNPSDYFFGSLPLTTLVLHAVDVLVRINKLSEALNQSEEERAYNQIQRLNTHLISLTQCTLEQLAQKAHILERAQYEQLGGPYEENYAQREAAYIHWRDRLASLLLAAFPETSLDDPQLARIIFTSGSAIATSAYFAYGEALLALRTLDDDRRFYAQARAQLTQKMVAQAEKELAEQIATQAFTAEQRTEIIQNLRSQIGELSTRIAYAQESLYDLDEQKKIWYNRLFFAEYYTQKRQTLLDQLRELSAALFVAQAQLTALRAYTGDTDESLSEVKVLGWRSVGTFLKKL